MSRPDLNNRQNIAKFVDLFYQKLLIDPRLSPLFFDVANIDLSTHLPHIKNYWCKLLLGDTQYQRHTMNIHRDLHGRHALRPQDFKNWLQAFDLTLNEGFSGPKTERARRVAHTIATNMENSLTHAPA